MYKVKSLELKCLTGDFTHLTLAWICSTELRAELYAFENALPSQQLNQWVYVTTTIDKQKEISERREKPQRLPIALGYGRLEKI